MKYDELLNNIERTASENVNVKKLLIDTCHIISESGNYSLCWIGLINEGTGRMEPIPDCITKPENLAAVNIALNMSLDESYDSDNIFSIGKYYVNNDIWDGPDFKEDLRTMIPPQFNSLAIFPVIQNLKKIGAVYLYSDVKGFFKHDELMLLQILSMNLSLALDKLNPENEERALFSDLSGMEKELKRQNEKLIIMRERTEELNRLRAVFLTNMGHKIRTPLNSIIGFAELLSEPGITADERMEYSQLIVSQSNNLLQNINNVLQISKLDTRTVPMYKETISLNSFLDEINDIYLTKLKSLNKKQIDLICRKPEGKLDFVITTDVSKLRQIFMNLLDNSVKFTDSGQINFGYYSDNENELKCFVSDTGAGINSEDQKDLFDIFKQVEEMSSRNYGDRGLGLAICKENAELLGGDIWVESEADKGTTFYFSLKLERKDVSLEPAANTKNKNLHWNTHEILIVEDDNSTVKYLTKILEHEGYKISVAHNRSEAEKVFQKLSAIDLVLLDMSLPDVSGLELVKQIKVIRNDIPVIAQTALTILDNGKQILDAGCDGYITKPYRREQIMNVINSYMT